MKRVTTKGRWRPVIGDRGGRAGRPEDRSGTDLRPCTFPAERPLDPTTRALEAYLEASVERLRSGQEAPHSGLLVLSAWHEAMPALVHLDPVLEAVDSRVFAVLWLWARAEGRSTLAFPSYDYLIQRTNVQARSTVARSLAILRITRWVTLCRRVRDRAGRYRGNVYALHEEPLGLASTFYLDPSYMSFLEAATRHHHARVRQIAQAMLQSLGESIDDGEDVLADPPLSQADRRIEALSAIQGMGSGNFFGFHRSALTALRAWRWTGEIDRPANAPEPCERHRVQNLNSVEEKILHGHRVQNSNSALCSSYLNKTTTTTPDQKFGGPEKILSSLIYPEPLSENERRLASMYLKDLDPELQQALLDELSEKIRAQAKTDRRVRNPIGLLAWMCKEAAAGRPPLTSAHLQSRARRERERLLREHDEAEKRKIIERAVRQGAVTPKAGDDGSG